MKTAFHVAFCLSFLMGMFSLVKELSFERTLRYSLAHHSYGSLEGSHTIELIGNEEKFINSQIKALRKRSKQVSVEIFKHVCLMASSILFLSLLVRTRVQGAISNTIDILPKFRHSSRLKEIAYISLICTLIIASIFGGQASTFTGKDTIVLVILFYTFLALFVVPTVYILINKLLKIYSKKLILACYLAYFIKAITEFITLEDVNMERMKNVDISEFSDIVREYLNIQKLQNKVYSEKNKKSSNINAALIGWGSYERIEIYGNYQNLSHNEFESILMHEIGHSQDHSLLKKISTLFILKMIEMTVIFQLYTGISNKFADSSLSRNGSFAILFLIYFLFMNRWLMMIHKIVSQIAESSADMIAKSYGYGRSLARVLHKITVNAEVNIQATTLFNTLKSYHPTIYSRIETLTS